MKHLCLSLLCFLSGWSSLSAQPSEEAFFELNLSYDTIGLEESLTLNYILHNTQAMGQFTPPNFTNGQLVTGPMVSQSMSSINGHVTRRCTYTYVLKPEQLGILLLPATAIETEAGWLELSEQTVVVVAETPARPFQEQQPMVQRSPFDHPFFQQQGITPQQDLDRLKQLLETPSVQQNPLEFQLELPVEPAPKRKKKRKTYRI
ncbi:MAG: BatD family protein [Aureispira sp.]